MRAVLIHVPYKSTGLAIYAVTAGEVPVGPGGIFAVKSLVDSGRLRALALAGSTPSNLMLQVPTFRELGWPTPEDYSRIIRTELEKWGKIIRNAGIKVE